MLPQKHSDVKDRLRGLSGLRKAMGGAGHKLELLFRCLEKQGGDPRLTLAVALHHFLANDDVRGQAWNDYWEHHEEWEATCDEARVARDFDAAMTKLFGDEYTEAQ